MTKDLLSQKIVNLLILDKEIGTSPGEKLLLKKASENRVLYEFCQKVKKNLPVEAQPQIKKIIKEGNLYLDKLTETLKFIKELKFPCLVVKTNRNHCYVTYDVDLLVSAKNKEELLKIFEVKPHPQGSQRKQINLIRDNLLVVDLHEGFYWQGSDYLDPEMIWQDPQEVLIQGVRVLTPSREVEILLNLVHFLFERRYLTLLEFWYFYDEFKKNFNKDFLFEQAKKYHWSESLEVSLAALETVSREFLGEKNIFSPETLSRDKVTLPFFLTVDEGLKIFWEKLKKRKKLPAYDLGYYLFASLRYYLSGKKLFPYYREWFDFNKLK